MKIIKELKTFNRNKNVRTIIKNIFSLYLIKAISILFPLLILPIIIKTVGDENYGKYIYSFTIIQYLLLFVNYGFQYTGTRQIARAGGNINDISRISSEIVTVRLIFAILTSLVLISLGFIYYDDRWLYFYGCGILFGQAIQTVWFFQGIQKMHIISMITIFSKCITLILIFVFIKQREDYIYLNLIDSFSYISTGILSILILKWKYRIIFFKVRLSQISAQIKDGYKLFTSTILTSFYREANVIILAQFGNYKLAGYYFIAERLLKSLQGLNQPISYALFPYFSIEFDKGNSLRKFNWVGIVLGTVFFILAVITFIFSKGLVNIYLGDGYERVAYNLMILSPVILFGILNYYYGFLGLVNKNKDGVFTVFIGIAGITNIFLCVLLVTKFSDIGAAIALTSSEVLLFIILISYWKIKIKT